MFRRGNGDCTEKQIDESRENFFGESRSHCGEKERKDKVLGKWKSGEIVVPFLDCR